MSASIDHTQPLSIADSSWSLFLDRDGVINERIPDGYVTSWDQFRFLPGVLDALKILSETFGHIFIVTNQQGVGRRLMTEDDLIILHEHLLRQLANMGVRVNKIYHCPHLATDSCPCRKPKIGMALEAKRDFPGIDLHKSVMVGDMPSDLQFAKNANMFSVLITNNEDVNDLADLHFPCLLAFSIYLKDSQKNNHL